jgi:outer membrane receptor protein involved in Fe transport
VKQIDAGLYAQDDWRVRPNLTFSVGVRYENQTNISSLLNFAPRVAMAWSPGAANFHSTTEYGDSRGRRDFLQPFQREQHAAGKSLQRL